MSIRWPGRSLGSHAWILIAMLQLAVDFPSCESLGPGPEFRLMPRPAQRPPRLWSLRSGQPSRPPTPMWTPRAPRVERAHGQMQVSRARRAHRPRDQAATLVPRGGLTKPPATAKSSSTLASSSSSSSSAVAAGGAAEQQSQLKRGRRHAQDALLNSFDFRGSRPTTETEFIAWGPTGDEEPPEANTFPGLYGPTTVSVLQTRKTTVATTTTTTTATSMTLQTRGLTASLEPWRKIAVGVSTTEPSPSPSGDGTNTKTPRILGETSGRRLLRPGVARARAGRPGYVGRACEALACFWGSGWCKDTGLGGLGCGCRTDGHPVSVGVHALHVGIFGQRGQHCPALCALDVALYLLGLHDASGGS